MQISFIIPVFNGELYIQRCLNSICQVMTNIPEYEIIVVDDCSKDNTVIIVEEYIKKHSQVRLLRQTQNHRQGAARNRGLKEAQGEYVLFVDGDDYLLPGFVAVCHQTMATMPDMLYFSTIHEKTLTELSQMVIDLQEGVVMTGSDFCEKYYNEGVFWYPWSYCIKRNYLLALNYPFVEDRQHEDRDWLAYVLSHASSVCYCATPSYRYCCNPSSTCRSPKYSTVFDHIASGLRHIDLSKLLSSQCPNLSAILYSFGVDEIYKSIRLRNLTKYSWTENKHLYDEQHLQPLLHDLKRICKDNRLQRQVHLVVSHHMLTNCIIFIVSPIARIVRYLKH